MRYKQRIDRRRRVGRTTPGVQGTQSHPGGQLPLERPGQFMRVRVLQIEVEQIVGGTRDRQEIRAARTEIDFTGIVVVVAIEIVPPVGGDDVGVVVVGLWERPFVELVVEPPIGAFDNGPGIVGQVVGDADARSRPIPVPASTRGNLPDVPKVP